MRRSAIRYWRRSLLAVQCLWTALLALPAHVCAEPVAVRYSEGLVHGFLVLRALNGQILADGRQSGSYCWGINGRPTTG